MDRLDHSTQADYADEGRSVLDDEIAAAVERDEVDPLWKSANDKLSDLYCAWNDGHERIGKVIAEVFYDIESRYTELAALLDQLNSNPLDA